MESLKELASAVDRRTAGKSGGSGSDPAIEALAEMLRRGMGALVQPEYFGAAVGECVGGGCCRETGRLRKNSLGRNISSGLAMYCDTPDRVAPARVAAALNDSSP